MDVKGKKVTVVGMGISGKAASLLLRKAGASVYCTDSDTSNKLTQTAGELKAEGVETETGGYNRSVVENSGLIVVSPAVSDSCDILKIAESRSIPVVSEIELACWFCKAPIIAVTGTNGKSTAVAFIGLMLEHSGKRAVVCGNVGIAFSEKVLDVKREDFVVLEVSSFQLKRVRRFKPKIALITNITQNHLDWHDGFDDYFKAKMNIYGSQDAGDICILNYDDEKLRALEHRVNSRTLFYSIDRAVEGAYLKGDNLILNVNGQQTRLSSLSAVGLHGRHNISNVLACSLASYIAGASPEGIKTALEGFKGLAHRFEHVATLNGIRYIDDSKATTVDACRAALSSCAGRVILIAGGRDKGSDFKVISRLVSGKVKSIILLGEAKDRIRTDLEGTADMREASSMDAAVRLAGKAADNGDTVLLSPMCASFDMYSDYRERGKAFKQAVNRLRITQYAQRTTT